MEKSGMFIGQHYHNIDEKGRLIIPSKFRELFLDEIYITKGFDGCLSVYSPIEWKRFQEKLLKLSTNVSDARKHIRVLLGTACETSLDKQGRINLPINLIKEASLTKECIIIGALDHIEIWSKDIWDKYYQEAKSSLEEVAEKLGNYE